MSVCPTVWLQHVTKFVRSSSSPCQQPAKLTQNRKRLPHLRNTDCWRLIHTTLPILMEIHVPRAWSRTGCMWLSCLRQHCIAIAPL